MLLSLGFPSEPLTPEARHHTDAPVSRDIDESRPAVAVCLGMQHHQHDVLLGLHHDYARETPFSLSPDDRRRHLYVIGKTGTGKFVFLENIVIQDILAGRGVAFINPHGDSASRILDFHPAGPDQ
jgi:hypothetical protein